MYSPDLAPMDFAVLPYIKSFLRGMRFDNLSELRQAVMNVNFLRNCLDASVLFVIFSSDSILGTHRAQMRFMCSS
jgi:hypothetical protein